MCLFLNSNFIKEVQQVKMLSFWSFLNSAEQRNDYLIKPKKIAKNSNSTASIHHLPDEILVKIFNLLHFKDRCRCERVCRRWQSLVYYGSKDLIVLAHEEDKVFTFFNTSNVVIIPKIDQFFFIVHKISRYIESLKVYGFEFKKKGWKTASRRDIQTFIDLIGEECRNIKYLSIRKVKNLDEKCLSELLEKIGHKLSGFSYDGLISEELFNLALDKLNPDKLTDLTCLVENSKVLKLICDKFIKLKNLNMSFYKDVGLDLGRLQLEHCSITNHHLKPTTLINLFCSEFNNNLRFLGLECIQVDSSVVNSLGNFKKLEVLKILISKQDDLDIICKSVPSLRRFVLSLTMYPNVDEIRSIKYLQNLRSLEIKCRVAQKLKFEKAVIPQLKHLSINSASFFNEKSSHFNSIIASNFPNLVTLKYKNTNLLDDKFFKMLDDLKRLRLLVCFVEQVDLHKTINKLKFYSTFMTIDLVLCKRKSESNNYFFGDLRPLHYLEPRRSYNLPKLIH